MADGAFVRRDGFLWPASDRWCHAHIRAELADLDVAVDLCRHRRVAVQAGGNVGVWAAHLAQSFARVVTFEPDPDNFACLAANVPAGVVAHRAALGSEPGRGCLIRFPENVGATYVMPGGDVPVGTVDAMVSGPVDLLALDVEGAEMAVLRGSAETLERWRPVVLVEDAGLCRRFGVERGDAARWLAEAFGYRVRARRGRDVILSVRG